MTSLILWAALADVAVAAMPAAPERPDLSAEAQQPDPYWSLWLQPRVSLRVAGEFWQETAIAQVYGSGAISYGAAVGLEVFGPFGVEVEATYRRLQDGDSVGGDPEATYDGNGWIFETVPVTALLTVTPVDGDAAAFWLGVGPAWTVYSVREADSAGDAVTVMGAKASMEARLGLRIHTNLLEETAVPIKGQPTAIEWELYAARRFQFAGADGFDLSAWRVCVGLGLSF